MHDGTAHSPKGGKPRKGRFFSNLVRGFVSKERKSLTGEAESKQPLVPLVPSRGKENGNFATPRTPTKNLSVEAHPCSAPSTPSGHLRPRTPSSIVHQPPFPISRAQSEVNIDTTPRPITPRSTDVNPVINPSLFFVSPRSAGSTPKNRSPQRSPKRSPKGYTKLIDEAIKEQKGGDEHRPLPRSLKKMDSFSPFCQSPRFKTIDSRTLKPFTNSTIKKIQRQRRCSFSAIPERTRSRRGAVFVTPLMGHGEAATPSSKLELHPQPDFRSPLGGRKRGRQIEDPLPLAGSKSTSPGEFKSGSQTEIVTPSSASSSEVFRPHHRRYPIELPTTLPSAAEMLEPPPQEEEPSRIGSKSFLQSSWISKAFHAQKKSQSQIRSTINLPDNSTPRQKRVRVQRKLALEVTLDRSLAGAQMLIPKNGAKEHKLKESTPRDVLFEPFDFLKMLQRDYGYALFMQHLAKEHSCENLKFWKEVNEAVSNPSLSVFSYIYYHYIKRNSEEEINVSGAIKDCLQELIEDKLNLPKEGRAIKRGRTDGESENSISETHDLLSAPYVLEVISALKEAQIEILKLMQSDSLPRFRERTPFYKEYIILANADNFQRIKERRLANKENRASSDLNISRQSISLSCNFPRSLDSPMSQSSPGLGLGLRSMDEDGFGSVPPLSPRSVGGESLSLNRLNISSPMPTSSSSPTLSLPSFRSERSQTSPCSKISPSQSFATTITTSNSAKFSAELSNSPSSKSQHLSLPLTTISPSSTPTKKQQQGRQRSNTKPQNSYSSKKRNSVPSPRSLKTPNKGKPAHTPRKSSLPVSSPTQLRASASLSHSHRGYPSPRDKAITPTTSVAKSLLDPKPRTPIRSPKKAPASPLASHRTSKSQSPMRHNVNNNNNKRVSTQSNSNSTTPRRQSSVALSKQPQVTKGFHSPRRKQNISSSEVYVV